METCILRMLDVIRGAADRRMLLCMFQFCSIYLKPTTEWATVYESKSLKLSASQDQFYDGFGLT